MSRSEVKSSNETHIEQMITRLNNRYITVNDDVRVGERDINLFRPRSADDLISETDFEIDERLPYWAELWPSSTVLANYVASSAEVAKLGEPGATRRCLELGCGVGLVSVAAAAAGFEVLATDYYEPALEFTAANAFRNGVNGVTTQLLDWRDLPRNLGTFDLILASDVLYELEYAELIPRIVDLTLKNKGICLIADPGRVAVDFFRDECERRELEVSLAAAIPFQAGAIRQEIAIYRLSR